MTEPVDAFTLHAQNHLFSMVARGVDGDTISADMQKIGWPPAAVTSAIYAMLSGAMLGEKLTPSDRAVIILMGRAVEDTATAGGWRLDGQPTTTIEVIRAANVVLKNFSMPMLKYPGLDGGAS